MLALETASPGNRHCATIVLAHLRSLFCERTTAAETCRRDDLLLLMLPALLKPRCSLPLLVSYLIPNSHRPRRRHKTILSRCVGQYELGIKHVGQMYIVVADPYSLKPRPHHCSATQRTNATRDHYEAAFASLFQLC